MFDETLLRVQTECNKRGRLLSSPQNIAATIAVLGFENEIRKYWNTNWNDDKETMHMSRFMSSYPGWRNDQEEHWCFPSALPFRSGSLRQFSATTGYRSTLRLTQHPVWWVQRVVLPQGKSGGGVQLTIRLHPFVYYVYVFLLLCMFCSVYSVSLCCSVCC